VAQRTRYASSSISVGVAGPRQESRRVVVPVGGFGGGERVGFPLADSYMSRRVRLRENHEVPKPRRPPRFPGAGQENRHDPGQFGGRRRSRCEDDIKFRAYAAAGPCVNGPPCPITSQSPVGVLAVFGLARALRPRRRLRFRFLESRSASPVGATDRRKSALRDEEDDARMGKGSSRFPKWRRGQCRVRGPWEGRRAKRPVICRLT